ncbi:MAG: 30S ribosomal protein S16 [Patescibacteria group bacterium]
MLTIKLARRGKKNQPFFRLIIQEKSKDPFGDFLEDLGYWNPRTKKGEFKKERILYWISKGAQMTDSVNNLLINQEIIKGEKRKVTKEHRQKEEKTGGAKKEVKTEIKVAAESKTETPPNVPTEENK